MEQWAKQPGPKTVHGLRSRLEDSLTAASQAPYLHRRPCLIIPVMSGVAVIVALLPRPSQ
ncbi:hypothetical protein ACFVXC_22140 [Streptomyces sp. NPDC058257]|uniref:hypothetical protein n=1 Tax=Streptomyces sp. NPDC058257 TaxID=3346409 RepID=UPI0036E7CA6C